MTAMRPILVSVGLHASAVLLLALVPFGVKAMVEHRRVITTDLVELPPPIVEKLVVYQAPSAVAPMVPSAVVNTNHVPPVRNSLVRTRPVTAGVMKATAGVPVAARPSSTLSPSPARPSMQAVPEFIAMPPGSNVGNAGARTADRELGLSQDAGPAVSTLSLAGGVPAVRRALPALLTTPRVFMDSSAENAATSKSKVKSGNNLRPEYPRLAREAGWEGTVMLRVEVLSDGKAGAVNVHKTSGYSLLDDAAVTAVQRWHFTPAMDGNFPVSAVVHLPVKFDLRAP
jgi:TonB family protein